MGFDANDSNIVFNGLGLLQLVVFQLNEHLVAPEEGWREGVVVAGQLVAIHCLQSIQQKRCPQPPLSVCDLQNASE